MKNYLISIFLLGSSFSSAFASIGSPTPCTSTLAKIQASEPASYATVCRKNVGSETSLYQLTTGILKVDGPRGLRELRLDMNADSVLLSDFWTVFISDAYFVSKTGQWVAWDRSQNNNALDLVFLLPLQLKTKDDIIVLSQLVNSGPSLMNRIEIQNDQILITESSGKLTRVPNRIPSRKKLVETAFDYFDVRNTRLTFMQKGLPGFPAYTRVKAIVEKCNSTVKETPPPGADCLKQQEQQLEAALLTSAQAHSPENTELINFLKDPETSLVVGDALVQQYREQLNSPLFEKDYDWSQNRWVVPYRNWVYQYTYDLDRRVVFFSPGMLFWKYDEFEPRYAYYPIQEIR